MTNTESKPILTIATLGHIDQGKTTLTKAIVKTLAGDGFTKDISEEGLTTDGHFSNGTVGYHTATRQYAHIDLPNNSSYIENLIAGVETLNGAILVVSAKDGVMPDTRDQIKLASELGVSSVIIFINKLDEFDEKNRRFILGHIKRDITNLLRSHRFDTNSKRFVVGSALLAAQGDESEIGRPAIRKLLAAAERFIEPPKEEGFVTWVEETIESFDPYPAYDYPYVTGLISSGTLKKGDVLQLIGFGVEQKVLVKYIEVLPEGAEYTALVNSAEKDTLAGLVLDYIPFEKLKRGQVICTPGIFSAHNSFLGKIIVLDGSNSDNTQPITKDMLLNFYLGTTTVSGTISPKDGRTQVEAGEINVDITVNLSETMGLKVGQPFAIQQGEKLLGAGRILGLG